MGVFDSVTKVKCQVPDPLTDHTLPASRSLGWTAITTPAALAGTMGAHCELVHGDRWHLVHGSHTENITRHQQRTVGGNRTIRVAGNHKETIAGNCYQNIIGPHIVTTQNVVNETRMGPRTQVYGDLFQHNKNDGIFLAADNNLSSNHFYYAENAIKAEVDGINVTAGGVYVTGWVLRVPLMGFHLGVCGLDLSQKALHIQNEPFTARIHGVLTQTAPGVFDMLTRLDGSIDIGSGTPLR